MAAAGVLIFYLYFCCIEIIGVLICLFRVRRGVSGDNFVAHVGVLLCVKLMFSL